jgi:hypothetical protein
MRLNTLACDDPFDVVFLEFWSPREIPDKSGHTKVLTSLDCMTSFADVAFLGGKVIDAEAVAMAAFGSTFIPRGLPRTIIVNATVSSPASSKSCSVCYKYP